MIGVAVLGSTGSIGVSTLDVLARHPQRFRVVALTANRDVEGLAAQCEQHRPAYAVMADERAAEELDHRLRLQGLPTEVWSGGEGLARAASLDDVQVVMAAIVGAAGLRPTLAAAGAGKRVLLANKEALVMAGPVFMEAVRRMLRNCCPSTANTTRSFNACRAIMPAASERWACGASC